MDTSDRVDQGVSDPLVAPGWEGVADAFQAGLTDPATSGAALSVWHDGTEVVRLLAGTRDDRTGAPWSENTLGILFSCTKGLASIVLAILHESGRVDLEAPLSSVWPEFGAHGKGEVSVADVLAHRGGVSAPLEDLALSDVLDSRSWASKIAAQAPLWFPGSGHSYHALTIGPIVQEVVRRVTKREIHQVFADEIASLLDADVTLLPDAGDLARVVHLTTSPTWDSTITEASPSDDASIARSASLGGAFPRTLVRGDEGFNDPKVLAAGLLGAGGLGTASGLGRIWSATVRETMGVRLLSDEAVVRLRAPRSEGPWVFDPRPPYQRWGAGVQITSDFTPWFSPDSFGHDGAGGQSGIADPNLGIGMGYIRNRMDTVDPVAPIVNAILEVLR